MDLIKMNKQDTLIQQNEKLLSLKHPINLTGKIISIKKWGKERNGKRLIKALFKISQGYADRDQILISGSVSEVFTDKNDLIDIPLVIRGKYKASGSKNDSRLYFAYSKIEENGSINLDDKPNLKIPEYKSVMQKVSWSPSVLKPDYDIHLKGITENISGVGDSFFKKLIHNSSFLILFKHLLLVPDIVLSQSVSVKNTEGNKKKIQALSEYLNTVLSNPRSELSLLMRLSGFQKKQINSIVGTNAEPVQTKEIMKYLNNPYKILNVFPTLVSFSRCDFIALMLEKRSDDLKRYQGLILAQIAEAINDGNICIKKDSIDEIIAKSDKLNNVSAFNDPNTNILSPLILNQLIEEMIKDNSIAVSTMNGTDYLYMPKYKRQEAFIADNILKRVEHSKVPKTWVHYSNNKWIAKKANESTLTDLDIQKYIEWYQNLTKVQLAEKQKQAISMVLKNNISLLAGGAGYGKTATTAAIVQAIRFFWRLETICEHCDFKKIKGKTEQEKRAKAAEEIEDRHAEDNGHYLDNLLIRMAGSTGRAAQQMMISLKKSHIPGVNASTIHSLYHVYPGSEYGHYDKIDSKFVIIDESSMIDLPLMYSILKRTAMDTHILFIGDPNQLPSVGPGRVFHDLIDSHQVPTTILDKLFRTGAESLIALNSAAILQGRNIQANHYTPDQIANSSLSETSIWVKGEDQNNINKSILGIVKQKIAQGYNADQLAVMSPEHGSKVGVDQLNLDLQNLLNPLRKAPQGELNQLSGFRPGDRVMQIKNDWGRGVINGDKGKIIRIVSGNSPYALVKMDEYDKPFKYYATGPFGQSDFDNLRLGYAGTVHKYQGDSGLICICAVSKSMAYFLDRTLLYTAATRAIKQMIFVGDQKSFVIAVHKVKDRSRLSLLKFRLNNQVTEKEL